MKHKKRALFQSIMSLILCFSMLVGTTFAWFTDSVSSASNIIQSGRLDIEMHYSEDLTQDNGWKDASTGAIFNYEYWEPGYTDLKYLKIDNTGNLAFTYQLTFDLPEQTGGISNTESDGGEGETKTLESQNLEEGSQLAETVTPENSGNDDELLANMPDAQSGETGGGEVPPVQPAEPAKQNKQADALLLAKAIDVYYANVTGKILTREEATQSLTYVGTLSDLLNRKVFAAEGILLPEESLLSGNAELPAGVEADKGYTTAAIMLKMREDAGNEYMNLSAGNGFCLKVVATQYSYEKDAFGNDFDTEAVSVFPAFTGTNGAGINLGGTGTVETNEEGKVTTDTTIGGATIPQGTLVNTGVNELTVSISEKASSDANLTCGENEALRALDVHIEGVSPDNTVPIQVDLGQVLNIGLNQGNVTLYHVEDAGNKLMTQVSTLAELDAHNEFYYDPATGNVTVSMATFSEVALVADTVNAWEGNFDYSWYVGRSADYTIANADQLAAFGAIVGGMNGQKQDSFTGKTVKLIADINLGDKDNANESLIFYPIGYYYNDDSSAPSSTVYSFEGTFDGDGHTIANFYQNTWEIKGDYDGNYYKDGMGLFGYVVNGTVKNLTVDNFSSDGEFTPTGVIAAYAAGNSTFENIAITKCTPRVYNTGNGGIIGIAGDTSAANDDHITLKNITVDNTNTISALWGSYDVACGGLVGMYRGNVDGSGNATGDTISFENCHVSAIMDVYNDVCGNYQYYAYRYAGMIIGSVRHNKTENGKTVPNMEGISASSCTVNYGDWNDYYYCEFVKNGHPSYSGPDDYKFSRVPNNQIDTSNGKENATCIGHNHTDVEDNQAVYLPFHQLFTGYSWGVSSIGLEELDGIKNITVTVGKEESEVKFETKFTGDFLYRVGNQNAVSVGSLFAAKNDDINSSGVVVTIDKLDENTNVSGTFTANTTDWTKGSIQFNGTGVVKVTIQDYNFCKPTELIVEVVDATNITSAIGTTTGGDFVLLCNVNASSYTYYWDATLYGNGFTYSLNGAPTNYSSSHGHGVLLTKNATLDNLVIVGDIYEEYGAFTNNNDYNAAIDVVGDTVIQNCYISGCSAPISARANVTIKNTTLYGGAVANLVIKGGTVMLENVTTANYDDGRKLVGMGIVVHADAAEGAKLVLNGTLTQYNFISEGKAPSDSSAKTLHSAMFSSSCSQYHFGTSPNRYVNTGIISLTTKFVNTNIEDNANTNYLGQNVSTSGFEGYVYTQPNTSGSVNNNYNKDTDTHAGTIQGAVPPSYSFDYTTKNYVAKMEGSNDYCYLENGVVKISMDDGDTFNWDTAILTVGKTGRELAYTVSMNGTDYTGKSIAFNTPGDYEVKYSYTDPNNYKRDKEGNIIKYDETYTKTVKISVAVIKETTKHAEFTMGSSNVATEKITIDSATYISAKGVEEDNSKWSYMTINGQKVYYPIVEAMVTSTKGSSTYAYFPVLKNVVTITDYADGGTGSDVIYNSATTEVSGLTAVKGVYKPKSDVTNWSDLTNSDLKETGANKIFKWASSSDAPSSPTTYNNVLCYKSPEISANRNQYITLVQYSYTDAAKTTYYYYVGYTLSAFEKECVTPDTLITLANGKQVRVDSLTGNEQLLVWNMETGKLDSAPIMFVDSDPKAEYEVIHLYFSDGTDVKVISEHGFWDYDLNRYVYLDRYADKYIGHTFAKQSGSKLAKVKLTDVVLETELTTAWSPVTAGHLCYFVNGMLSMPGGVGGLFNIFDVDPATMTYDYEAMAKDIEAYGLFTYEEMNAMVPLSEDMFNAAGGAYLKISIGKGNMTLDDLVNMIQRYSKYI